MRNIKLIIEYDGTDYHGWQSQQNAVAVQDVVRKAIKKLTGEDVTLTGSSRTDTGVHAYGQVANFMTDSRIPADRFCYAINTNLPEDIAIKSSVEVDESFHARFSTKGKKYRYLIYNHPVPPALLCHRAWHEPRIVDFEAMKQAAPDFLGEHDFSAFKATGSDVKTNERTITYVDLKKEDELITFEIAGNGFLYNMVRIIVGTLVDVGLGKIPADSISKIIESRDRRQAGMTAPAHGLYLVEVYY